MTEQITIPRSYIAAALQCSAKNDARYYLNGVCIQRRGDTLHVVATDGHVLFRINTSAYVADATIYDGDEWVIPVETARELARGKGVDAVTIVVDGLNATAAPLKNGNSTSFTLHDRPYPDWRRVIPQAVTAHHAQQFNAMKLAQLQRAFNILQGIAKDREPRDPMHLYANADSCMGAAMAYDPTQENALGIVMPFRYDDLSEQATALAQAAKRSSAASGAIA